MLWSTQRLSTFMSTQRISRHVDIIFNISTKEQWKNKMSIITHEAASLGPKRHINKLRALMNRYEGKLIMYACVTRESFVFTVFRRVFHAILKLELCRHACRRRDQIIATCRYGKNMPTTALVITNNLSSLPGAVPG